MIKYLLLVLVSFSALGAPLEQTYNDYSLLTQNKQAKNFGSVPPLPKTENERAAYAKFLQKRLGIKPKEIDWTHTYPLVIRGQAEAHFFPEANRDQAFRDQEEYDAIIVGGGPAGLTAGAYLVESKKKILILEQGKELGGLAAGELRKGVQYGRGSAYFSAVDGELADIYKHLGLGNYKKFAIPEYIDSFFWNGKYYAGLWESEKAMAELPASFAAFKFLLKRAVKENLVFSTPFRGPEMQKLDSLSMEEWVKGMPEELEHLAEKGDGEARAIWERFRNDKSLDRGNPMSGVIGLLQLYGRSALGDHPDQVSAQAFASFYQSELETRYSSNLGAGAVSEYIIRRIKKRSKLVNVKTEASVAEVRNVPGGVEVAYVFKGETRLVRAKHAVVATPLNVSRKIIQGFSDLAPKAFEVAKNLEHRNYIVVNVHLKGHPWTHTYDLWVRNDATYSQEAITDIIDGRWMDFAQHQKRARTDDRGMISIYKPLPKEYVGKGFTAEVSSKLADQAIAEMKKIIAAAQLAVHGKQEELVILAVEVNRWPYSIHLVKPGYLTAAQAFDAPIGNIYLGNNNMGVPAVEEGVYRGYQAAQQIIRAQP